MRPFAHCSGMRRTPLFTLLMLALAYGLHHLLTRMVQALERALSRRGVLPVR